MNYNEAVVELIAKLSAQHPDDRKFGRYGIVNDHMVERHTYVFSAGGRAYLGFMESIRLADHRGYWVAYHVGNRYIPYVGNLVAEAANDWSVVKIDTVDSLLACCDEVPYGDQQ